MSSGVRRWGGLATAAAVAGCFSLDGVGVPGDTASSVPLFADTTRIGELVFFRTFADGGGDPDRGTRIFLRVGDRPLEQLALTLQAVPQGAGAECATPGRVVADTVLTDLPAGAERTVLPGVFGANVAVFVGGARRGGLDLVSSFAGRWEGSVTEFRAGVGTTRPVRGTSRSDGGLVLGGTAANDPAVVIGDVGTRQRLLGHDGVQCGRNWAVDSSATFTRRADSLIVRGRVGSPTGAELTVDSIRLALRRR